MPPPDASLSSIEEWLTGWFAEKGHKIARDENFFDANGVDSLGVIELIEDSETNFNFTFGARDFQDRRFPTIAGLALIINERLHQR